MKAAPAAMMSAPFAIAPPVGVAGVVASVTLEPPDDVCVAAAPPVVPAAVLDPERAAAQIATAAEAVSMKKLEIFALPRSRHHLTRTGLVSWTATLHNARSDGVCQGSCKELG